MEVVKNDHHDAEGLQAVEQHDYPEVVPGQDIGARRNSMASPEAYVHSNHERHQQQQPFLGNGDKKSATFTGAVEYYLGGQQPLPSPGPPQYYDNHQEKGLESQEEKSRDRRICGLTRKVFILVLCVALLVILGVALGVGLGIGLSANGSSDNSSSSADNSTNITPNSQYAIMDKAGMALLTPSGSSTTYAYFICESGMLVETAFANNGWSHNSTALPPTTTNVTSLGHGSNSPISAVSYTSQGNTFRALFFFDSSGHVLTTNTTGNNSWPAPYALSYAGGEIVTSQPNTMSLAAVAGSSSNELNGFRVYLGSNEGFIREIGMDFADGQWNRWAPFEGTDPNGGVASVIVDNVNHLYLRSASGQLQMWTWSYQLQYNPSLGSTGWEIAANSTASSAGVASGGSIAAATDGQSTDYIFYQDADRQTVQALYSGTGTSIAAPRGNVQSIQAAPVGYSLAATYANGGAVVVNQNSTRASELLFSSVNRNGGCQGFSTQTA